MEFPRASAGSYDEATKRDAFILTFWALIYVLKCSNLLQCNVFPREWNFRYFVHQPRLNSSPSPLFVVTESSLLQEQDLSY